MTHRLVVCDSMDELIAVTSVLIRHFVFELKRLTTLLPI